MIGGSTFWMTQRWSNVRATVADPWRLASLLGLVAVLALAPRLALDSGFTYDEQVHVNYGDLILAWYRSGFEDQRALDFRNLYLYGGLFDLPAQWLISQGWTAWGPYETRHVLTALVAVLGAVGTWLAAARIGGSRAGFLAALTLLLTPAWIGHGMFNPKDIPFGAAVAFVAYACVSISMRATPLRWSDALRGALAYGAALGVRSGGMFLGAFLLLAIFGRLALDAHATGWQGLGRKTLVTLARVVAVLPIAYLLMLSAWPWAQVAPFERPFEAASIAAHFDWGGHMRFNGRTVTTSDLPLSYLPVWFAVTLPEIYAFALLCGITCLCFVRRISTLLRPQALALACLLSIIIVPYLGVIIKRPTVYDAHRHFLFFLPAMAVLAGVALGAAFEQVRLPRVLRLAGVGVFGALALLVLFDITRIHPYEYVYFNRLYGGLPAANGNFETDYWGASFREGFEWVVHNVPQTSKKPVKVAVCNASPGQWQVEYLRERWGVTKKYVVVKGEQKPHKIYLGFTRGDCHKRDGEVLHVVERMGVPLLYVLRR